MQEFDVGTNRILESTLELGQRRTGSCTQHHVKGLPVRPGQTVTGQYLEHLEEFAITQQQRPLILEARQRQRPSLGASAGLACTTGGCSRKGRRFRACTRIHRDAQAR